MGVYFVACHLMINLHGNTYVSGQFLGTLLHKTSDTYTVDFTDALKKQWYAKQAAPFVKKVNGNNCMFIGGPK